MEKNALRLSRRWSRLTDYFRRHPRVFTALCVLIATPAVVWGIFTLESTGNHYIDTLTDQEIVQLAAQIAEADSVHFAKSIIEKVTISLKKPQIDAISTIWGKDETLYVCGRRYVAELDETVGLIAARQPDHTWANESYSTYFMISAISNSTDGILFGGIGREKIGTLTGRDLTEGTLSFPELDDINALWNQDGETYIGSTNGGLVRLSSYEETLAPVSTALTEVHAIWGDGDRVFFGGAGNGRAMIAMLEKDAWTTFPIPDMEAVWTIRGNGTQVFAGGNTPVNRANRTSGAVAVLQADGAWQTTTAPGMDAVRTIWHNGSRTYAGGARSNPGIPNALDSEGVIAALQADNTWTVATVPGLREITSIWGDGERVYAGGNSALGGLIASPKSDSSWAISMVPGFQEEGLHPLFETKSEIRSGIVFIILIVYFQICVFGYVQLTAARKQKEVLEATGAFAGDDESEAVQKAQLAREAFAYNLTQPFRLRGLEVRNLAFYEDFGWAFQPQVNVLLGKNGYGKSHLLRAITALLLNDPDKARLFFTDSRQDAYLKLTLDRGDTPQTIHRVPLKFEQTIGQVPILAIPDARFINRSRDTISRTESEHTDLKKDGAYHFLYEEPYEAVIQNFLTQLCIDIDKAGLDAELPRLVKKVVHALTDRSFAFHEVRNLGQGRYRCLIITEGNPDTPLPIQKASQGTLSVLAMFGLIYDYLRVVSERDRDVLNRPAIVFIDEIDAHLHPSWQQKIVNLLREHFPRVQFIITAHSPLVVAGCLNGEVAVLQKLKSQQFKVHAFQHDFIGWQAEDIYRTVFEVEDKDENYKRYSSLSPHKQKMEAEIQSLQQSKPTQEVTAKLVDLQQQVRYIEKADDKQHERLEYKRLERENERLTRNNRKLEALLEDQKQQPAQRTSSELEAEIERLRWQHKELQQLIADLQRSDESRESDRNL